MSQIELDDMGREGVRVATRAVVETSFSCVSTSARVQIELTSSNRILTPPIGLARLANNDLNRRLQLTPHYSNVNVRNKSQQSRTRKRNCSTVMTNRSITPGSLTTTCINMVCSCKDYPASWTRFLKICNSS